LSRRARPAGVEASGQKGSWGEGIFARPSDWILKFGIRIFVKKCSNFVQNIPLSYGVFYVKSN